MTEKPLRILLVEDNPGDVALMRMMLSEVDDNPFQLETASRLSVAFEQLAAGHIDLILLDLTLPDASGLDTVVRTREHAPRTPIIVMTGLDDEDLALKAMQHGAQDYVVKGSVDGRMLVRAIRYALERTRTERELSDQRGRLDGLLRNIPDRIYFKNAKGEFIQVNPALAHFFGLEHPEDAIGKTDSEFFTEEHASQAARDEAEIMRTKAPLIGRVEKETFPGGRIGWSLTTKLPLVDDKGAVVGTFGVSRDITGLKTAEEALRESEERYRGLLDSVTDYVYSVTLSDGQPFSTSHGPGCLAVTGYSPDEFKSDAFLWHRTIHPEDREEVIRALANTSDGKSFEIEHRIVRRDGAIRWVRNKHVPHFNEKGNLVSYDGLLSDITERKLARIELEATNARLTKVLAELTQSHEELKTTQSQLMQLEKLHSIGQLAAGIAHEVKNPLQIMLVGIEYLAGCAIGADEQTKVVLNEMQDAVRRASTVIGDLLDFSSPRELGMHPRPINALVEQSLRFVRHELTVNGVKIVTDLAKNLPEAYVDPTKIEQVFVNLLTNACHAMHGGGTLTVRTLTRKLAESEMRQDAGDRSGIRFRTGESAVVVEIRDTGPGIPTDKLDQIFEPFFTTKSTGKGTGLGLSVTKKIVDLHKGRLTITNNPEGGVVATVTFRAVR